MNKRVSIIAVSVITAMMALPAFSFDSFKIKKIQFSGLNRVSKSSIASDINIKPGQVLTEANSNTLIKNLYNSAYFQNVQLLSQKGTLVVKVIERPAIASVTITGNKKIKTKLLKSVMRNAGFTAGNLFDRSTLREVVHSLEQAYYDRGKYAVRITETVVPLPRDRVGIDIKISEGLFAKISHINFVGNQAFPSSKLADELTLSTPSIWTFFTHKDRYSRGSMASSLNALSSFYMDRGYINFHADGSQVALSRDKKHIFLSVDVTEGGEYHFSGYKISGETILPLSKMQSFVSIKKGDLFSRAEVVDASKAMMNALADKGYAFAHVTPVPKLDKKTKTVNISFYVYPGKIQYIRYINFYGNTVANDYVLRERMELQEQSRYNKAKMQDSKRRLQRLSYFKSVGDRIRAVPGYDDLIDMDYNVQEMSANKAGVSFGYSELNKIILGGHLIMPDFFSTGNIFNTSVQLSKPFQSVNFGFDQPYFTKDGIGQNIGFYFTRVDNKDRDLASYTTNSFGSTLGYSIPLDADDFFNVGVGYDNTRLMQATDETSDTVNNFIKAHGNDYNSYLVNAGWSRNTTNNAYFPSAGSNASVGIKATTPGSNLRWYKILVDGNWYKQVFKPGFTFNAHGDVDYGNGYAGTDHLPFFQNFYAGGWGTVRGFAPGSLGPSDAVVCKSGSTSCTTSGKTEGNSLGGNLLLDGSLNFYFPIPFLKRSNTYRMGVFADAGNVYTTYAMTTAFQSNIPKYPTFGNLRYSAGVAFEWRVPMLGLIGLSLAKPFNTKPGDSTRLVNFTFGHTF